MTESECQAMDGNWEEYMEGGFTQVENYEPHPIWGDFSGFYWGAYPGMNNAVAESSATPVMMQVDDSLAFIPMQMVAQIVNVESGEE